MQTQLAEGIYRNRGRTRPEVQSIQSGISRGVIDKKQKMRLSPFPLYSMFSPINLSDTMPSRSTFDNIKEHSNIQRATRLRSKRYMNDRKDRLVY